MGKPFVLFRNILEESEHATQEEVAILNGKYVIIQIFTHGGFLPSSFQHLYVFTLEKFLIWIMERSRELFLQCLDNLNEVK
jgi:hypothetical protein